MVDSKDDGGADHMEDGNFTCSYCQVLHFPELHPLLHQREMRTIDARIQCESDRWRDWDSATGSLIRCSACTTALCVTDELWYY